MSEAAGVDRKLAKLEAHGLADEEWERILEKILGPRRRPTRKLGIFSVMWSEHCSYKSSRRSYLRTLPTEAVRRDPGPGRERRRGRHRATAGGGVQDREPQPPLASSSRTRARPPAWAGSCATSSPWERRPLASLNSLRFGPLDDRAPALPDARRGLGHRRLRQLLRLRHRRGRGDLPSLATATTSWSTR